MSHKEKKIENKLLLFLVVLLIAISIFLFIGINKNNAQYLISTRGIKLLSMILSGTCIAVSTLIFQTVTDSRILTPSVMGLDSMYVFLQTMLIFTFKRKLPMLVESVPKFIITTFFMILVSVLLQSFFTNKSKGKVLYMILIGMIVGTFLDSLSNGIQMIMDPDEFLILQSSLFASYNKVNVYLLGIAYGVLGLSLLWLKNDIAKLDVMSLGYSQSINLGLDYKKLLRKKLTIVGILVSISTALVGPVMFLGLLTVNISKEILKTYKHRNLLLSSTLLSIIFLILGQLIVERIFNNSFPVGTIINFVGGIYLLNILLKERKVR
ncbi:iron chelate uptake ABC transporter family permease subunit [Cetobacterium sp. 8H]|uniref:iron chelate uptake ABC transporter family permease subunit n=1 Tax=Cetobacterium sp. 8H TaxID=2759681 RepID=UPI00163D2A8A|nr:iron chelate uptake ABC transporter family permease subunit [Cetobacterium sp. 8H]MBC2850353.1 iron chelate uptake ABC transporter family permease subunit [Cetobacterium sp. 8H]